MPDLAQFLVSSRNYDVSEIIKEDKFPLDKIGVAAHLGEMRNVQKLYSKNLKGKTTLETLTWSIDNIKMGLKWGMMWTAFIWLKMGANGRFKWSQY
jgi:hypothetical protein